MEVDNEIFQSDETREYKKIFRSDVTRVNIQQTSDFRDLLCVTPATPIPVTVRENETCIFEPKSEKYYVPKRRSRLKVRTVRDIRNLFEQDNYRYIVEDMERQQDALLSKIRTGSAFDLNTQNLAKKLLKADHPISRTAWQMLSNINAERNANPTQFVLWNGRRIRVVGSKGGKTKFISNYDLEKKDREVKERKSIIAKNTKKHGLLRNSLSIKIKPGPLRRKKYLDDSHQKYHVGPIELVKLPKPALDIHPAFGKVVEPVMANFLNILRPHDGTISEKWAEFTVSVLGTVKNNGPIQYEPECCVTFDLCYKYAQNRLLMRRDIFNVPPTNAHDTALKYPFQNKCNKSELKNIMDNILDSVEISLMQDSMYADEKESQPNSPEPRLANEDNTIFVKEKCRKKFGELDRLDVTVIRLPGTPKMNPSKSCGKAYCNLGCVCDSLNCTYKFKQHCGYSECMFGCKCKMSKFKDIELLETGFNAEFIPGLMNLNNAKIANLSKEEQKFHQTVVFRGENSILLNPRKRNTKFSKKCEQLYTNVRLKNEVETKKILTVVDKKLNISNIEPWCMVHNLYRCFCKGRFTESATLNSADSIPTPNITPVDSTNAESAEPSLENIEIKNKKNEDFKPHTRCSEENSERRRSISVIEFCLKDINIDETFTTCARVNKYESRKYNDIYYTITNNKIKEMEKNDTTLHNRMLKLMKVPVTNPNPGNPRNKRKVKYSSLFEHGKKQSNDNLSANHKDSVKSNESSILPSKTKYDSLQMHSIDTENTETPSSEPYIPFEISGDLYKPIDGKKITQDFLTPWIAKSYKHYIEQSKSGKNTLERPKKGRIILHLWESLLERYTSHRNLFLTTRKGPPFRIYIATDIHKPFFNDCINIDTIRQVDVHKYPCVVRKLLTSSSSKDYFCILGGWDDCWEIIGSVKKNDKGNLSDSSDSNLSKNENSNNSDVEIPENWHINEHAPISENDCLQDNNSKSIEPETIERSKWFLMKLENDFTEIYCHKKGFYVEYEKLLSAINLARLTHKTVVINKQTSTETESIPFGIYALPLRTEYFAVVGPYEIEEPLGLEIVKSKSVSMQTSTKGYWLTTNKVDNLKVLDDPMAFLPKSTQSTLIILSNAIKKNEVPSSVKPPKTPFEKEVIDNIREIKNKKQAYSNDETTQKKIPKLVKPIKIRRTNGFYHLTPNNNTILKNTLPSTSKSPLRIECLAMNDFRNEQSPINNQPDIETKEFGAVNVYDEPETEASHIKITSVYSENVDEMAKLRGKPGMFILNPEQINNKINVDKTSSKDEDELNMDIKNFLSSPKANKIVDNGEYLVISDDDDDDDVHDDIDDDTSSNVSQKWSDVWLECSNIKNLAFIHGKRNSDNLLCIDFPGFEPNKLYTESEAMDKINETMSGRIAIPEEVKLKWQVVVMKNPKDIKKRSLKHYLFNNSVKEGKKGGMGEKYRLSVCKKTNSPAHTSQGKPNLFDDLPTAGATVLNQSLELFQDLENTSRLLEHKSVVLMSEAEKKQSEISDTFRFPEASRVEMSETLQQIMTMNDDTDDDEPREVQPNDLG